MPECTHIISKDLKPTEKLISAIAAGKWVLRLDFITITAIFSEWEQEEVHEWANGRNDENNILGIAAKRCREIVSKSGKKMMSDWSVLNLVEASKRRQIKK